MIRKNADCFARRNADPVASYSLPGRELSWHLQKEGPFPESRTKFYVAEIILGLRHLHSMHVVYRDLKPENILLDIDGHVVLCDFGLSKVNLKAGDTTNSIRGTLEYLAPEVLLGEDGYTMTVDYWSLGVIMFEMACGWSPFYADNRQQMYKNITFGNVRFPRDVLPRQGHSFIKGLLNRNPKHRLGAINGSQELMDHPWFEDIDWTDLQNKLIPAPFVPKIAESDKEFGQGLEDMTGFDTLKARAEATTLGFAHSTPLSPTMQSQFKGFTFVDKNMIE